ncbi:DNA-formamidopyrimidine glycosylase family protein [Arthrobacter celericrescens]|uniref:DNA-formamidopyrimidine glycosylase family protein n=1 Tax=Arthrobacter celericrescens TaxID=2320851 RepID=UPI000EA26868|nr:DNA-formamidopyrimidine glycosylase family protein [Arthrobacter celericrescens]
MPELPELTALAAYLDARLAGATVVSLQFPTRFALKSKGFDPESLAGRTVRRVHRRGKFLVFQTSAATDSAEYADEGGALSIVVSFAKAGWLLLSGKLSGLKDAPEPESGSMAAAGYVSARFRFSNHGTDFGVDLTDEGRWKGLAVFIVHDPEEVSGIAELGPEALDPEFTLEEFTHLFTSRQRTKDIIRDQKRIAGIGNGYSDEILHAAKLSPLAPGASLDAEAVGRLYATMRGLLGDATEALDGLAPDKLKAAKKESMAVHGRTGESCPVCGTTIQELAYVGTSFQYCPGCQSGGEILKRPAGRGTGEEPAD